MEFLWTILGIVLLLLGIVFLFVYIIYLRPLLEAYRMAKTVRSIFKKLPLNKYRFNAQGLQDLQLDATTTYHNSLTAEERDFVDSVSLDVFKRIGKFIRK